MNTYHPSVVHRAAALRRGLFPAAALAALLLCTARPAAAEVIEFKGAAGACQCQGFWNVGGNWEGGDVPDPDDVAWIPSGKKCMIPANIAPNPVVMAIQVDEGAELELQSESVTSDGCTLTITHDSTVDGLVNMHNYCALLIGGDLTITGTGGRLFMAGPDSTVANTGTNYRLKLNHTCGQNPLAESCAFKLHGVGTVSVKLTNDAFVVADHSHTTPSEAGLHLTTHTKDGRGLWGSRLNGVLKAWVPVAGTGLFKILDTSGGAKIVIHAETAGTATRFLILRGTLEINQNLCTEGWFDANSFDAEANEHTNPIIKVAEGKTARFDVQCP